MYLFSEPEAHVKRQAKEKRREEKRREEKRREEKRNIQLDI